MEEDSPELKALMATLAKSNMSHQELDKLEAEEAAKAAASAASPEEPPPRPKNRPPSSLPRSSPRRNRPIGEQTAENAEPAPAPSEPPAPAPEAPAPEAPAPEAPAPEAPAPEAPAPEAPTTPSSSASPPPKKSLVGKSDSVKVGNFSEKLSADAGNKAALQGAHAEIQKEAIQEEMASNPDAADDPAVAEKLAASQNAIDAAEERRRRKLKAAREQEEAAAAAPVAVHLRVDVDGNLDVRVVDRLTRAVLHETTRAAESESADDFVIRTLFGKLDADWNGTVSVDELVVALNKDETLARTLGIAEGRVRRGDASFDAVIAHFEAFDADGSGELDVDEFARMVKSARPVAAEAKHAKDGVEGADEKVPTGQTGAQTGAQKGAQTGAQKGAQTGAQTGADQAPSEVPSPSPPANKAPAGPPPVSNASDAVARARAGDVAAVDEVFAFLDADGDGTVTVRELRDGVLAEPALGRVLGLSAGRLAEDEVEALFSRWDADGDRRLDREEFGDIFGDAVIVAKAREDQAAARGGGGGGATRTIASSSRGGARTPRRTRAASPGDGRRGGGGGRVPSRRRRERRHARRIRRGVSERRLGRGRLRRRTGTVAREPRGTTTAMELAELSELPRQPRVSVAIGGGVVEPRRRGSNQTAHRQRVLARTPQHDRASTRGETREGEGRGGRAGTLAGYKERWRDGLRNGDIERFAPGKQTRRASGGGGAWSASKSPSTSSRTIASKLGASSTAEALKEIESTAPGTYLGKRMFSRGFQRMYLSPPGLEPRRDASPTVDPPGVKTSAAELVGVVGLSGSRHKEDLRHKGSMQPLSFHRNVLGDKATTHTSTAPDEYSKYPRAKRKNKVWVA